MIVDFIPGSTTWVAEEIVFEHLTISTLASRTSNSLTWASRASNDSGFQECKRRRVYICSTGCWLDLDCRIAGLQDCIFARPSHKQWHCQANAKAASMELDFKTKQVLCSLWCLFISMVRLWQSGCCCIQRQQILAKLEWLHCCRLNEGAADKVDDLNFSCLKILQCCAVERRSNWSQFVKLKPTWTQEITEQLKIICIKSIQVWKNW